MNRKFIIIMLILTIVFGGGGLGLVKMVKANEYNVFDQQLIDSLNQRAGTELQNMKQGLAAESSNVVGDTLAESPKGLFDDVSAALSRMYNALKNSLKEARKSASTILYKNSLRYFLNKVAYDTATYIATGDKGKKPLFITEGWTKYFQKVGDEAVGDFFYRLGKNVWGKNLCVPWDPLVQINLTVAAKKASQPQTATTCTWVDIKKNLTDLRNLEFNQLIKLSTHFNPSANELGTYLSLRSGSYTAQLKKEKEANLVRIIEGQYKSVTDPVSGTVKTPANLVKQSLEAAYLKTFTSVETYTGDPVADAIGTFSSTLVSKYLERIFKKGFNPITNVISDFWSIGSTQAAKLFFSDLAQVNYKFNTGMSLSELTIDGSNQQQFNGVISDSFRQAVEQKCTLGQAMGYYKPGSELYREDCWNGNSPLIDPIAPLGYTKDIDVEPSPDNGLPHRTLLVLRKFRIIPVGLELAAEYYNKYGRDAEGAPQTFNLQYAVEKFDDPYDPTSPYFGLVDPDWILKFPITRCAKEGASPDIISRVFAYCYSDTTKNENNCPSGDRVYALQRLDYCADYETCLDDRGGSCAESNYGYCLEEKSAWNIKGDVCTEKNYASCQTLTLNQKNSSEVSYLLNTVSGTDICNENNTGCREYCTQIEKPFEENSWLCTNDSIGDTKYLTANAKDCNSSNDGCSLIYKSYSKDKNEVETAKADGNYDLLEKKYLKLAPDYYGCDGYTTQVNGVFNKTDCASPNFWRSDLNICVVSGSTECANYSKMCTIDDVSCKLYTPSSVKDPAVPAIIESKDCAATATGDCFDEADTGIVWNDECPAVCVGYKDYYKVATQFETSELSVNLIAKTGTTCSTPGCDQFTNLDEVAKGGEGIEYFSYLRQCMKPDANNANQKVYYTWEGSDTAGYQLKKWTLVANSANDYTPQGTACNNLSDKDCREFFDINLEAHKIYYSSTIVVSDNCHPYRRTIANISDCTTTNGQWENGACIYMAIPEENKTCNSSDNMCREYKSNESYNYQKIINSSFEKANNLDGWTGGTISNESLKRNDYSLRVTTSVEHELATGDLLADKTYVLEFLAKGLGSLSVRLTGGEEEVLAESVALTDTWYPYSVKLPNNNEGLNETQALNTKITISGWGYLDNIVLKRMDKVYLIKNSWITPAICDFPVLGEQSGCESYRDSDKNIINLKNFNNFCFEEVVGCEEVVETNNYLTDSPEHPYEVNYLVVSNKYSCTEKNMGCTRLGLMTPNRDDPQTYSFTDSYKLIHPEESAEQCQIEELYCENYLDNENKSYYFKNPTVFTCEFKNNIWVQSGTETPCWSTDLAAYAYGHCDNDASIICKIDSDCENNGICLTKHCVGGRPIDGGNNCNSNADCTNLAFPGTPGRCTSWVGMCADNSSGCREYQDPQRPEDCNKNLVNYAQRYDVYKVCNNDANIICTLDSDCTGSGKCAWATEEDVCDYYYYKNVEICSDTINPNNGCAAFNETSNNIKDKRSYKVCSEDINKACEVNADCGNSGTCRYTNIQ